MKEEELWVVHLSKATHFDAKRGAIPINLRDDWHTTELLATVQFTGDGG